MIVIVLALLSPPGPPVVLRSQQRWGDMAACQAALGAQRLQFDRLAEALSDQLGRAVVAIARCAALNEVAA